MEKPLPTFRHIRSVLLRWELGVIVTVMVVVLGIAALADGLGQAGGGRGLITALLILLIAVLSYLWILYRRRIHRRLAETARDLSRTRDHMATAFRLSHRFAQAQNEAEIIAAVLESSLEVTGALGASFVSLDERGHPLPTVVAGELPPAAYQVWSERLASPEVRHQCQACQDHASGPGMECPLFPGPYGLAAGVLCLPLRRGDHELGKLNLYLAEGPGLDPDQTSFLNAMMDEMALAVEAVRLRQKELAALQNIRQRRQDDRLALLPSLLEKIYRAVEADFAYLALGEFQDGNPEWTFSVGTLPAGFQTITQGLTVRLEPDLAGLPGFSGSHGASLAEAMGALLIRPLRSPDGEFWGWLIVGRQGAERFNLEQSRMLDALADHLGSLTQYTHWISEFEYRVMINERVRLAREIHDGLAQTLGFLKLMTAQMALYFERGQQERVQEAIHTCQATLAEAYSDARQAIDDLRTSSEGGLASWVQLAARDYEENSDFSISMKGLELTLELPSEVQAQLIRIVQEALTNIRKHACAREVTITARNGDDVLQLEIFDDGRGFQIEDVVAPSRHGLRGMQERAALIGADLQIESCPDSGTRVRVRLPLAVEEAIP